MSEESIFVKTKSQGHHVVHHRLITFVPLQLFLLLSAPLLSFVPVRVLKTNFFYCGLFVKIISDIIVVNLLDLFHAFL